MQTTAVVRSLAILPVAAFLLTLAPWSAATANDAQQSAPAKPAEAKAGGTVDARAAAAFPGEDLEAKRKDIRRLLELNGAKATATAQIAPMMKSFEGMPGMTPEMVDAMKEEFLASLDEMLEMSVDPYVEYLSHDDIKAMIAFAETPAGQRIAAAQPKIVADTTVAGVKWGQGLQPRIMKRMNELRSEKVEGSK